MTRKTTDVDWWAVTQAAQGLGINTRRLVALHDPDAAITWALSLSRQHTGVAALSYYELAVMLGHDDAKVAAGATLDWNELLHKVETIAGAVRVKIMAEKLAADDAKAAAERKAVKTVAAEDKAAATRAAERAAAAASKEPAPPDNAEDLADNVTSEAVPVSTDAA